MVNLKKETPMKTLLTFILLICISAVTHAQSDSLVVKSDNLLDMQSKTLTKIFGTELDGNATGESIGYLELLNRSELTTEQKQEYKNLYFLQAEKLTQRQKDSLGRVLEQKIREAQRDE
ncbi:hypothetical protein [Lacinutrix salivirga]